MGSLVNLDLLSVGIAVASIGILGFSVFFNNQESVTNESFLIFAIVSIFWNVFNYLIFKFTDPEAVIWILRIHVFFAVWYCFFLFRLFYVFPKEKFDFGKKFKFILIPLVVAVSLLTLTPYTFIKATQFSSQGSVETVMNGWGVYFFGATVVILILSGFVILLRKTIKAVGIEKKQLLMVLFGFLISFTLHIVFNLVFPVVLANSRYAPLGAVFTFPLIAFTAYAIFKHKLLNTKIIATEILAYVISVVTFVQVILASDILTTIFHAGVFVIVLAFSILLIKSVRKEVEQREKLEKLTRDLEAANEKLKELDELKSEFLSFASHQVKSPMAVVKGYASLIEDGSYGQVPAEVKDAATKIKESVNRLITLVNNLLDLRKIEQGKMELKFEDVNIPDLVKSVADEFRNLAVNKKLVLNFNDLSEKKVASVDSEKFRQVVQNIVDNSIKYTEVGQIDININQKGNEPLTISIHDTGAGISAETMPKLFGEFERAASTASKIKGTGLGLYIAKQIITGHKGKIWAESPGEGSGSTFFIEVPIK